MSDRRAWSETLEYIRDALGLPRRILVNTESAAWGEYNELSLDGMAASFDVNVIGLLQLVQTLFPRREAIPPDTRIMISSSPAAYHPPARFLGLAPGRVAQRVLAELLNEHLAGNEKQVYFEAIHSKMKTFSPGSMAIFALETAGGINIAFDAKPRRGTNIAVFGKEKLLTRGADIDVFLAQVGTMNRVSVETIKKESGFQVIKAVRNGEIYLIDEMIVSRPTLRLLYGIYEIGRVLYPEIYNQQTKKTIAEALEG